MAFLGPDGNRCGTGIRAQRICCESFRSPNHSTATASEGYRVRVDNRAGAQVMVVAGNDSRGVFFGIGRLLRELHMTLGTSPSTIVSP